MSSFDAFQIAGSAMTAQSVRLNTVASNLANANVVSSSPEQAYRARMPVFETVLAQQTGNNWATDSTTRADADGGVRVSDIVESNAEPTRRYAPSNPKADADGYVYGSNVNISEEMANMVSASRSYQSNVELMNTVKQLMLQTLRMGQ